MELSPDYTQTVRSLYEAFAHRDRKRLAELLDPQIEWTSAENFLYADHSPYVGLDAIAHLLFERVPADWDNFSMKPAEVLGGGEIVIASGRFRGKFKANGASLNAQFVQVFQFKDGKIVKSQMYTDTAHFKETIAQVQGATAEL